MNNPSHIDRNHPVHAILDRAASGNLPSSDDLDHMLTQVSKERLPAGQNLDRFRNDIIKRAADIAAIRNTGAHGPARQAAANAAATLAERMTPEERAIKSSMTSKSNQDVDDLVRRIFEN